MGKMHRQKSVIDKNRKIKGKDVRNHCKIMHGER